MIAEALFSYVTQRTFLYQSIASLGAFLVIRVIGLIRCRRRRYKLIREYGYRGPEQSIWYGNMYDLRSSPARFLIEQKWLELHGPTFAYAVGDHISIVTEDLQFIKDVFLDQSGNFAERINRSIRSPLTESVLFAKHHRWRFMRKVMAPAFSRLAMRGESSTQFVEDSVRKIIEYIDARIVATSASGPGDSSKLTGADVDIQDLMKSMSLKIISDLAINLPDVRIKEDEQNVRTLDTYLQRASNKVVQVAIIFPFLTPLLQILIDFTSSKLILGPIHDALARNIDLKLADLRQELKEKQQLSRNRVNLQARHLNRDQQQATLMDILIRLYYDGKLSREEVVGNANALLFAGYETTSTTLTYVLWVLAKHVQVQDKLRDDLKAHGMDSKYLDQVLDETMRLYPTVINFTTRVATKTTQVAGGKYTVPKGASVLYETWLFNRNPKIWPNPEVFDPSRFEASKKAQMDPCAFAPFGLGERKCLGYQLAMLEMKMVVCDILLRYKLNLKAPHELELISSAVVLTKPKEKVMIGFERLQ